MGRPCFTCGAVLGVLAVVAMLVTPVEPLNYSSQKVHKPAGVPQLHRSPTSERLLALELIHLQFLAVGGLRSTTPLPKPAG
jgi:hypothetical protein